jgi:hypothetical protein
MRNVEKQKKTKKKGKKGVILQSFERTNEKVLRRNGGGKGWQIGETTTHNKHDVNFGTDVILHKTASDHIFKITT